MTSPFRMTIATGRPPKQPPQKVPRFSDENLRQVKETKQAFVGQPTNACLARA